MVVPLICRVLSTPLWGWAFDNFNLAFVRIYINLFFLLGLFCYFQTHNLLLLIISSAMIGTATGGGTMAWALWVTKVAPKGRESTYMSIHSFYWHQRSSCSIHWLLDSNKPRPKPSFLDFSHFNLSQLSCIF